MHLLYRYLGNLLEFLQRFSPFPAVAFRTVLQTVVDVIVHQGSSGLCDSLLDGIKLLGDVEAGAAVFNHGDR
jgi:hypothetical protein